ncbi:hypothetical protein [Paludisphaera soli]|uniref:hypothetical protein n=1 Tax=Paludisphaera soli TaxID=2712865 RepID=UPI0013EC54CA|nr:hypothetical protein [Paludisphaera soli]
MGGGGRPDGGDPGQAETQEEEPIDPIREPEDASGDTVAPRNQDQSELVLRTIRDLLDKNADTSDLEAATGMSRTEMDQFVKQYEKLKSEPAGPGREIEVEPGQSGEDVRATPGLPGLGERARSSSKAIKERGGMAQDEVRGNQEGLRFAPPPEFRGKVEGYKNALSRRPAPGRAPAPQPPAGGGTR